MQRLVAAVACPNDWRMDIAPLLPEPSARNVQRDRTRLAYASLGAAALVSGVWLAWLVAWITGWDTLDLGIRPRDVHGLVGILSAPFVHASFAHLMSNTLPLGILALIALYAYPRATRYALPIIWIGSGLGVWLWARDSVHVGISGIVHGLMFFVFLLGVFRRDRLGVAIALLVFFLYGGMVLTVLPRDPDISFEYHLFGAISGLIAAVAFFRLDPLPPRKRYSWDDEEDSLEPFPDEAFLPSPQPPARIIPFPTRDNDKPTLH
ncbi:MAG TPA: rhomboid family intramembrane serine protease [Rudaea sp.]|jgi:membrane associated rhomboid family serine protease|nr:rhomboid family intramembrane serine protease [Rudaea sp.]